MADFKLLLFFTCTTGEWSFEEPATKLFSGDLGLVLKVLFFLA